VSKIRPLPCEACPYRCDVASGVWATHEYEKLREYDAITPLQPFAAFACHASPNALCHGWAVVHNNRGREYELMALRLEGFEGPMPEMVVPLFASGNEAADHGEADMEDPSVEARRTQQRLLSKHPRLNIEDDDDDRVPLS